MELTTGLCMKFSKCSFQGSRTHFAFIYVRREAFWSYDQLTTDLVRNGMGLQRKHTANWGGAESPRVTEETHACWRFRVPHFACLPVWHSMPQPHMQIVIITVLFMRHIFKWKESLPKISTSMTFVHAEHLNIHIYVLRDRASKLHSIWKHTLSFLKAPMQK